MGRSKQKVQRGFVLFDVFYEDGTRTSNRKARVRTQSDERRWFEKGLPMR
jgi:hypothetical protein